MMFRIQVTNTDTGDTVCDETAETVAFITGSDKGLEYQGFKGYWGSTDPKLLEAMTIALEKELEKHGLPKRSERHEMNEQIHCKECFYCVEYHGKLLCITRTVNGCVDPWFYCAYARKMSDEEKLGDE